MKPETNPAEAALRVQTLAALDILDTPPQESFDRITRLASGALGVPIALVSLVENSRQWFKSKKGIEVCETPIEHSFCAHAIQRDEVFVVSDAAVDERFLDNPLVVGSPGIRFYAGMPLKMADGVRIGTVCVIDSKPRELKEHEAQLLRDLASLAVHELELRRAASSDPLTGAWNRRMLDLVATREFAAAERTRRPLSVAVLDIDHFKAINDRYGHDVGDVALVMFASKFREVMRADDWLFRVGGEEFATILAGDPADSAWEALDRFRAALAETDIPHPGGTFRMTVSGGVVQAADGQGRRIERLSRLLEQADSVLYRIKRDGRNCIGRVATTS
ncbi:sensor domain-containing diguanylate cyclase [Pseudoxanthobacter sp. M-2]|uniref:sensor domain-containing diguanylate cyclase n=1 Tax=Pseudoxanthobacter sp. M-2 TaxID=3078754 RepID=UPI0038FC5E4A